MRIPRSPFGSCGATCWQNRLATCCPRGARLSSSVEGISISTIGCFRPALRARIEVRALHVRERRRDDDAGGVMRRALLAGQAREVGQLRQRDVHAERAGAAAPLADVLRETPAAARAESISFMYSKLRIEIRDDGRRAERLAGFGDRADRAYRLSTMTSRTPALSANVHAARSGGISPSPA